jgi:hypothetical protein
MEVSIPLNKINIQNIYFTDKKKNIIVDGYFIKILYSTNIFEMNGLYILFELEKKEQSWTQIPNRTRRMYSFNISSKENMDSIEQLCKIEHNIIKQYIINNCPSKTPSYILRNQLQSGCIKYHSEYKDAGKTSDKIKSVLKISGVWESNTNVGITMKFILQN